MSDEPTAWELQRALEQLRTDLRDGFGSMNARLDRVPTSDLLAVWQARYDQQLGDVRKDVAKLQEDRELEARQRMATHRAAVGAIVTAVIAPILVGIVLRLVLGG